MKEHSASGPTVFVVDDDASVCAALKELFQSVGLHVELFASGSAFLENRLPTATSGCLVLDVRLPGMSGLKIQEELANAKNHLPIIFLTGHGDIAMAVHTIKAGAINFLTKPFRNQDLWMRFLRHYNKIRRAAPRNNRTPLCRKTSNRLVPASRRWRCGWRREG